MNAATDQKSNAVAAPAVGIATGVLALAPSCASRAAFFSQALRHIASAFESPYAAIYAQFASDLIDDHYHAGATDPAFWKSAWA